MNPLLDALRGDCALMLERAGAGPWWLVVLADGDAHRARLVDSIALEDPRAPREPDGAALADRVLARRAAAVRRMTR